MDYTMIFPKIQPKWALLLLFIFEDLGYLVEAGWNDL